MHPSQPPHQPDPIRQTQRNLLALARTNTAIDQHKRELKALLLQRRLRQLRQADPSAPPTPAPLSAGDLAATLEDDYSDDDLLGAPDPPAAPSSPAYALNPHVHDPQRAESGIFAAKRALVAGEEGRGVRARRVQREMRAVRGWETVSPPEEAADGRLPSRSGGAYEADPPRLAVPRPGVPAGAAEADLPDEVRGRLGLFSERERMEVSEAWLGLWAPPRADEDWPGVGSVVGEAGSQEEDGDGDGDDHREDQSQGEGR